MKNKTEYKVGDTVESGEVITCIIGSAPCFAVFSVKVTTKGANPIRWEVDDDAKPEHLSQCLELYDKLDYLIHSHISTNKTRNEYIVSNGRALFVSATSAHREKPLGAFELIHARITNEIQVQGKISYISASSLLGIAISLACMLIWQLQPSSPCLPYLLGAAMGAIGALLSIYQRCNIIEIPQTTAPAHYAFLGITRIVLGFLCGGLLVLLIKADIVIGIANDNLPTMAVFATLAGFSERYFPSILSRLEKPETPQDSSKT